MSEKAKFTNDKRNNRNRYREKSNWNSSFQNNGRGKYCKRGRWNGGRRGQGSSYRVDQSQSTIFYKNQSQISLFSNDQSQRLITNLLQPIDCPYKGWHLYMDEVYNPSSELVSHVQCFQDFILKNNLLNDKDVEDKISFKVDVKLLVENENVLDKFPNIYELLIDTPMKIVQSLGLAMHQILTERIEISMREEAESIIKQQNQSLEETQVEDLLPESLLPYINARLINHHKITPLKMLKANLFGKLVSVKGTVVRVGSIKPMNKTLAFSCQTCGFVQGVKQLDGKYTMPLSCASDTCAARKFTPRHNHELSRVIDYQSLKIQEVITGEQEEGGRVPRTIMCEVTEDLVDSCIPGDVVVVTGVVKVTQCNDHKGPKNEQSLFLLYLDANCVTNCKLGDAPSAAGIEYSIRDYYAIEKIQSEPNLFSLLCASLCPAIYGHEVVKAGLLLTLIGGSHRNISNNRCKVRSDPHLLLVGDPGLGKSQLLQACAAIAPRGIYVCGNTTTTSGLTVTLTREGARGDYVLEGGALVLADQGACCIDEFDKMTSQHQALLEAMEQQCISIAKAGLVSSLPCRTSIIAAANPTGGHYNRAKTVAENIKLNTALLSRFDLVFILMDKPDEELDTLLSEHVMSLHKKNKSCHNVSMAAKNRVTTKELGEVSLRPHQSLRERLKSLSFAPSDLLPYQLLRKYICYARKYVNAKLSCGAAKVLQKFYLELRQKYQSIDSTPITTRQLESMIRLAEARSRSELREEVTLDDAEDVVELMRLSMIDTYSDDLGFINFDRSMLGSGSSNKSQMKRFINGLQRLADSNYKTLFTIDELKQLAKTMNLKITDFTDFVTNLNNQGYLLKKGHKSYQLLC